MKFTKTKCRGATVLACHSSAHTHFQLATKTSFPLSLAFFHFFSSNSALQAPSFCTLSTCICCCTLTPTTPQQLHPRQFTPQQFLAFYLTAYSPLSLYKPAPQQHRGGVTRKEGRGSNEESIFREFKQLIGEHTLCSPIPESKNSIKQSTIPTPTSVERQQEAYQIQNFEVLCWC